MSGAPDAASPPPLPSSGSEKSEAVEQGIETERSSTRGILVDRRIRRPLVILIGTLPPLCFIWTFYAITYTRPLALPDYLALKVSAHPQSVTMIVAITATVISIGVTHLFSLAVRFAIALRLATQATSLEALTSASHIAQKDLWLHKLGTKWTWIALLAYVAVSIQTLALTSHLSVREIQMPYDMMGWDLNTTDPRLLDHAKTLQLDKLTTTTTPFFLQNIFHDAIQLESGNYSTLKFDGNTYLTTTGGIKPAIYISTTSEPLTLNSSTVVPPNLGHSGYHAVMSLPFNKTMHLVQQGFTADVNCRNRNARDNEMYNPHIEFQQLGVDNLSKAWLATSCPGSNVTVSDPVVYDASVSAGGNSGVILATACQISNTAGSYVTPSLQSPVNFTHRPTDGIKILLIRRSWAVLPTTLLIFAIYGLLIYDFLHARKNWEKIHAKDIDLDLTNIAHLFAAHAPEAERDQRKTFSQRSSARIKKDAVHMNHKKGWLGIEGDSTSPAAQDATAGFRGSEESFSVSDLRQAVRHGLQEGLPTMIRASQSLQPRNVDELVLRAVTIPAIKKHTASVIFIHGLGDTGFGWKPVMDMLREDKGLQHVKWILPHAPNLAANVSPSTLRLLTPSPTQRVTANMGMEMPSWFDIYSFSFDSDEDKSGMLKSKGLITKIIEDEIASGIDANRIFLGGFSQGGAMTLLTGLTGQHKLAGLAVLSGWLPLRNEFKGMISEHGISMPIFWGHGSRDPLVQLPLATRSVEFLEKTLGIPRVTKLGETGVSLNVYQGMEHSTCPEELSALKESIQKCIPANS
ncbi:hypothetical protein NP233_g5218 [Leucocoprinus birnbaumii]|uniref:Acyl-protein thioesterase 1 n=1 Tax=Leucocoprinus birnbaumii TaxID=56174 RepID=A0AAD5YUT4_9AGAR|nr:hypothetical protein NP233_g5218 [Leucocoprinus birnbaumii]